MSGRSVAGSAAEKTRFPARTAVPPRPCTRAATALGDGVGGDEERPSARLSSAANVFAAPRHPPARPSPPARREPERDVAHLLEHDAGEAQREQQREDDLIHGARAREPAQSARAGPPPSASGRGGAEREVRGLQHGE